jgi:hypothetical protein
MEEGAGQAGATGGAAGPVSRPLKVMIAGPPAAGKGTQCQKIVDKVCNRGVHTPPPSAPLPHLSSASRLLACLSQRGLARSVSSLVVIDASCIGAYRYGIICCKCL